MRRRDRYRASDSHWWRREQDTSPAERRAWAWHQRRRELLGNVGGRPEAVAAALGLSVRTLRRYEYDGAPAWYELALIGLARSVRKGQADRPEPEGQA